MHLPEEVKLLAFTPFLGTDRKAAYNEGIEDS